MICNIDKENRDKLEDFHVNGLVTLMEEGKPLDLNQYLGSFYRRLLLPVKGITRPVDKALSYIHISPSIIRQILRSDPQMESYFVDKGFDLTSLVKLDNLFTKSPTPLQAVQSFLGAPTGVAASITQQQNLVNQVAQTSGFSPESASQGDSSSFKAMPLSANTTTGQEALPGNIPDPSKVTRYAFQRMIINQILSGVPDSSRLKLPYGGLWLTAMHASKVPDFKGHPNSVLFAITDIDGNILSLNPEGHLDGPREVMYYESRQVTKSATGYSTRSELAPLTAIVKQYQAMGKAISLDEAESIRQLQLKQAYDIQEHIKGNPDAVLKTLITGGSLGYTTYAQGIRTPLSAVNFTDPLSLEVQQTDDGPFFPGAVFFRVKGIQQPVLLQRNEMSTDLINKIASTFVDPLNESHAGETYPISPQKRLQLIKQYLNNTDTFMTTLSNGELILHLDGSKVDLSDVEPARKLIQDYFNNYQATPGFKESSLSQDKKDKAIDGDQPDFQTKLYQGAIVKFKTKSGTLYQKYTKPAFNINNDFLKNSLSFDDYSIEGDVIKSNPMSYYDWLKKNTYINYELNKEGKLLALNSYFTYQLTDEAKDKLYPKVAAITFEEEQSPGYASRTHKNASADATIALATDFTSPGERATKSSVLSQKKKYIPIDVSGTLKVTPERVSKIVKELNSIPSELFGISLNIAGNGIYTMKGQYTQKQVDDFTYNLLKAVLASPDLKVKIASIRTGGQTGFDEAGAKAGLRLGIPTKILAPKRWAFRNITGKDTFNEQMFKARFEETSQDSSTTGSPGITEQGSQDTQTPADAVKSFIDRIKKEGLSKSVDQKFFNVTATTKQIEEAKTWYENSPLSKFFPFEAMFNVINSGSVAQWTTSGVTLYHGADFSDLYHEAWHGFSQGFLTKKQKEDLYNEVKKHSGSFTTHTGKRVTFAKASYLEIEEFLAEDFRKYVLTGGKSLSSPVRNTLFRRIWNFLKSLFGSTTYAQMLINDQSVNTVRDLYEKLHIGNINPSDFSTANANFNVLHKGILATDKTDPVQELSADESIIAVNTIDSIFSTILDELNRNSDTQYTNHLFTTDRGRQIAYEETFKILKDRYKTLYLQRSKTEDPQEKQSLTRNIDTLNYMIKNFGNPKDPRGEKQQDPNGNPIGLIAYHNRKSEFLSFEDKFMPEDNNLAETWAFKDGNEVSVYDRGKSTVWYLIRGLHKIGPNGKPVLNRLGFPELVDFDQARRKLTKLLASSRYQDMQRILIDNQDRYPYIKQLLIKLGDPHSIQENTFNMWNSFFQTMNSFRVPLPTMLLDHVGSSFISRVGEAYGDHKIVQRHWSNLFTSGTGSIKAEFVIRKPGATPYLDVKAALAKYPKVNRTNHISFLNSIGVPLERNEDIIKEIQEDSSYDKIGGYLRDRLVALQTEKVAVNSLYDLFGKNVKNKYGDEKNESTRYDNFARLQAKYSGLFSEQVSTPSGDTRSEYSLNQSITTVAKEINNSDTFQDILNTSLAYLDRLRNPFARVSKRLNSLYDFNKGGIRRKGIIYQVENLNGISLLDEGEATDIGSASSSADPFTKFVLDLHLLLQRGTPENPRHGEKSTSISTSSKYVSPYSKDGKLWMDPEHFLDRSMWRKIYDSILPYLEAELDRVNQMRNAKPGSAEFNYPDYLKNGKEFKIFEDILSQATKDKILKSGLTDSVKQDVAKDFSVYFQNLFDQAETRFSKAGFIASNVMDQFLNKKKDNPFSGQNKAQVTSALLRAFEFNMWIHNMEASIMHYGDPAQYKTAVEYNKRISMFSSTGDIFRSDSTAMEYINNRGMLYARSLGLPEKNFSSDLQSAIMEDPVLKSAYYDMIYKSLHKALIDRGWSEADAVKGATDEASAYTKMKIGDAQGWITFDSYRALRILSDKWSDKQEDLYQRIVKRDVIDPKTVLEYFPVEKYQYAGPLKTESGLPVMAGHKYSLFPLIPGVIDKSPVIESLHHKMMSQSVDYALFGSGSKITTVTDQGVMDKMYSDLETRTFDHKPFTKNVIYLDFLKDQQNVNSEFKEQATISTQMRKVIEEGLYENGKPISPEAGRLVQLYEQSVNNLTAEKKKQFIKEIGWDVNYGKVTQKLLTVIDRELARQDLSDHEREAIQLKDANGFELLHEDLSFHLSSEKIEKVLSSMVNRKLVRQKINGEPLVQVSVAGMESEKFIELRGKLTPEEQLKWGTNDLPYYIQGDKFTQAAKAKIAFHPSFDPMLQLTHEDGQPIQTLDRLNESIKNPIWLNRGDHRRMITIVGPRIPVQEQNSMEFLEVYEFLPRQAGNIIVLPAEIVAKSGADFDIDKVTMMFPNMGFRDGRPQLFRNYSEKEARAMYQELKENTEDILKSAESMGFRAGVAENKLLQTIFGTNENLDKELMSIINNEGKLPTFEEFLDQLNGTKAAENEFIWAAKNILAHPVNYANLVRPNGTFTMDPITARIRDHVTEYDPKYRVHEDRGSQPSFSRLNEYGYNHYVHQINKVSQEALAIAAVDNTANINFNRVGAHMNWSYKDKTAKARADQAIEKRITLQLPHNTLKDPKGRDVISLSHLLDVNGKERISGNISQMINLLLEIAKNDSAFYLQLNREVIPTLLFLQQAGVPIDHLIYFASQPIIREYMEEIRIARSPIAGALGKAPDKRNFFQNKARGNMISEYFEMEYPFISKETGELIDNPRTMKAIKEIYETSRELIKDNPDAFNKTRLLNKITSKDNSVTDNDRAVLLHWFEIEDMAKAIRDIKMRLNFDTKRSMSAFLAINKQKQIEQLQSDGRIPYHIVDNLLKESAISSLYIQPFMVDFLRPLFPVRANKFIGDFLISKMSSMSAMEEIEETFGDSEKFATRFFNDLMSYVFQNKLRDFKIGNITKYRNMNAAESLDVQQIPYLKFGAFVKDNTMYYDMEQLIRDFSQKNFTGKSYTDRGLAPVKASYFKTAKEFYNFVFEREYIRSYITPAQAKQDPFFKGTYEEYIRDKALDNIGNGPKTFEDDSTYADQVMDAIDHYDLVDKYSSLGLLTISQSKGRVKIKNLQLLDTDITADKADAFHQVLKELGDVSILKVDNEIENQRLSELFHRFSMVAFLQSGLNTSGSFSLVRLVPDKQFLDFMQGAVKEFISRINEPRLQKFYDSFIRQNTNYLTRARYKDYTASDPSTGRRTVSKNTLPIFDSGLGYFTFDPTKMTEKDAKATIDNNPDMVFIYDKADTKAGGLPPGLTAHFTGKSVDPSRSIGLPTLISYAQLPGKSLTDATLDNNKLLIDQAITDLKDMFESGLSPVFSSHGYGQALINLKPDGTPFAGNKQPGLKTFLYLSQRLFEEFGYVNRNYAIQTAPVTVTNDTKLEALRIADKKIDKDQVIMLEDEDNEQPFLSYTDLLAAYEQGFVDPDFMEQAYEELRKENLVRFVGYNPKQLSMFEQVQPSVLTPQQVLAKNQPISDQEVRELIKRCIE